MCAYSGECGWPPTPPQEAMLGESDMQLSHHTQMTCHHPTSPHLPSPISACGRDRRTKKLMNRLVRASRRRSFLARIGIVLSDILCCTFSEFSVEKVTCAACQLVHRFLIRGTPSPVWYQQPNQHRRWMGVAAYLHVNPKIALQEECEESLGSMRRLCTALRNHHSHTDQHPTLVGPPCGLCAKLRGRSGSRNQYNGASILPEEKNRYWGPKFPVLLGHAATTRALKPCLTINTGLSCHLFPLFPV